MRRRTCAFAIVLMGALSPPAAARDKSARVALAPILAEKPESGAALTERVAVELARIGWTVLEPSVLEAWSGRYQNDARCTRHPCSTELSAHHEVSLLIDARWIESDQGCELEAHAQTLPGGSRRRHAVKAACLDLDHAAQRLATAVGRPGSRLEARTPAGDTAGAPIATLKSKEAHTRQPPIQIGATSPSAETPPPTRPPQPQAPETASHSDIGSKRLRAAEPLSPPVDERRPEPAPYQRAPTRGGEEIRTPEGSMVIHDRPPAPRPPPATAGVKAGAADDNQQFNAFLGFLGENRGLGPQRDLSTRLVITVRDRDGKPISGARVAIIDQGRTLLERTTVADGRALLFPSERRELGAPTARLRVRFKNTVEEQPLEASRRHQREITLPIQRPDPAAVPLDVAFVLDTTGSMGDEIDRLRQTIDVIHFQITQQRPRPDVRFGMVLYRDEGDDYRTDVIPFTADLQRFRFALNGVEAGGGGDYPEDVNAALKDAMTKLAWRDQGVRMAFLIGDAPPHLDYGQDYTFLTASADAAKAGIKIVAVGCSGLNKRAEYVWRQIAQYTMSPFVFLTRGETGDSEGSPTTVSHHVGSNWVSENLDAIIVRVLKLELSHFAPRGAPPSEDYFTAAASPGLGAELVLDDLFRQSIVQLTDYAVAKVEERTPTLLLSVSPKAAPLKRAAEVLERRLELALTRSRSFQLIEQKARQKLDAALAEQLRASYDEAKMVEIGKLVPARLAVLSELDSGGTDLQLLLKLIHLETGEVLSVSLLKIDDQLVM